MVKMRIAAAVLFAVVSAGLVGLAQTQLFPAVDVSSAQRVGALDKIVASGARTGDTPIRMVDVGGYNVGVGVLYRGKGISPSGSSSHDKVTEIFELIEGSGTLVTGGEIVNAQRRDGTSELVSGVSGPGISGSAIQGGTSRHVSKGDMVIIPAGTPHWFSVVDEPIKLTVVRVDPGRVVTLR
jgi:mannose-6-phosphate isomerase-like protein (cupin superfamily)